MFKKGVAEGGSQEEQNNTAAHVFLFIDTQSASTPFTVCLG